MYVVEIAPDQRWVSRGWLHDRVIMPGSLEFSRVGSLATKHTTHRPLFFFMAENVFLALSEALQVLQP
jgi:hypothetical protein